MRVCVCVHKIGLVAATGGVWVRAKDRKEGGGPYRLDPCVGVRVGLGLDVRVRVVFSGGFGVCEGERLCPGV